MAPRTDRLRSIDPDALALSVGSALARYYSTRALPLSPGLVLQVDGGMALSDEGHARRLPVEPRSVGVALTCADLCRFAQSGDTADWGGPEGALDAAQSVFAALFDAPADLLDDTGPVPWTDRVEGDSDLAVVLRAGAARAWAETGASDIPATWLAELAGMSRASLAEYLERGELRHELVSRGRTRVAMVACSDAARWLRARGVLANRGETSGPQEK